MQSGGPLNRNTIFLEDAEIVSQNSFSGNQFILRVHSPRCAAQAKPGSFAHITCDADFPMRRPLSIMRTNTTQGWLEFLYKPVGQGLTKLSKHSKGYSISVLGPIGNGFDLDVNKPNVLAIGGGVGIPPMVFLSERYRLDDRFRLLVLMGSRVPFPFELTTGKKLEEFPSSAKSSLSLMESWGVVSRLASEAEYPGCFQGFVTELADHWLKKQSPKQIAQVQIVGCGPSAMLKATAELARAYKIPCQIALEEFMACGVGGCAGCTVLVETDNGPAMKRVCVDGPVFDAHQVYPA